MPTANDQLASFLEYYCNLDSSPMYALMVKGPWGCGKTYLIKDFMSKWKTPDKNYLYVSLYGLSSNKQVSESLFQAMHPILGSKTVAIGGRILKGTLKAALKIDLDGDGKDDGTINLQLPDVSLVDEISTSGYILVFDDLERCSIPIADILGYINGFVEHGGQKAIIIANESDIEAKDKEAGSRYTKIKEKLVGKTFEILPDVESALTRFVDETNDEATKEFLKSSRHYIIDLYTNSKNSNLRILRQFLLDFDRLISKIDKKFSLHVDFMRHFFGLFMCLTFEYKTGNLAASSFDIIMRRFTNLRKEGSVEAERRSDILARYPAVDFFQLILPTELWVEIIDKSFIDIKKITENIEHSRYFYNPQVDEWRTLWNYLYIEKKEFELSKKAVVEKFNKREYLEEPIILHVVGIFIGLSSAELIDWDLDKIKSKSIQYIDDIFVSEKFISWGSDTPMPFRNGYGGLGIQNWESDTFKDVRSYLEQKKSAYEKSKYSDVSRELIKLINNDPEMFGEKISYTNAGRSTYADIPVFSSIPPEEFAQALLDAKPEQQVKAMISLKSRYYHGAFTRGLADEKDWIVKVRHILLELSKSDPLTKNRFEIMCKNCLDNIDN